MASLHENEANYTTYIVLDPNSLVPDCYRDSEPAVRRMRLIAYHVRVSVWNGSNEFVTRAMHVSWQAWRSAVLRTVLCRRTTLKSSHCVIQVNFPPVSREALTRSRMTPTCILAGIFSKSTSSSLLVLEVFSSSELLMLTCKSNTV